MVLLRQLSYRLFLLLLEALCMIIAVHLGIVRIFFLQNDTHWPLDQLQLGRTVAALMNSVPRKMGATCDRACLAGKISGEEEGARE